MWSQDLLSMVMCWNTYCSEHNLWYIHFSLFFFYIPFYEKLGLMNAPEKTVNYSRGASENLQKNITGRWARHNVYNFRVNNVLLCGDHKWFPLNWSYGIHILHILFHSICLHHIIPDKWMIRRSKLVNLLHPLNNFVSSYFSCFKIQL